MGSISLTDMSNPSCLLYGAHDARYEDRPIPTITSPTDVIIRIAYTGVCGSDVPLPLSPISPNSTNPLNPLTKETRSTSTTTAASTAP